ncbi:hypothetical protein OGAPHI_000803 [Ogataea philodendri]|uniref:Actin-related protein n=1 Tax=Ogataea philodendri TaxID=1378263 RepID=A0A9P8PFV6_9ASCO|nr:uncharacterized protein OGAPHI_000803 [Ogataea philodendri]KAH3671092.1 hypothetical protein OGAPHI_000803 [Ogataea philodendri]
MPSFREDSFLIVQPGSQNTLVRFGIEDTLSPPAYSIPTKVYRNASDPSLYTINGQDESLAVYPIVAGDIVDVNGLNFLLKCIVRSILKNHPVLLLNSIAFTLVQTSNRWSSDAIENITKYVFESLQFGAFSVVPASLSSMFAYGSLANACVVDIGFEKTEVTPILDYQVYIPGIKIIDKGGNTINTKLAKSLPSLSSEQVEFLKRSSIFEVLSEEDASKSFFGSEQLVEKKEDDEGVLDVAAIVTSEKSTREILAEKEREKRKQGKAAAESKPNSELETNTFVDASGTAIAIGKERFQGCTELIASVATAIHRTLGKITDLKRAQECYDNIILVGQTTKIHGFKEALMVYMYTNFVVGQGAVQGGAFRPDTTNLIQDLNLIQVPKHVKFLNRPDYFSEWKKAGFEDCSFLGAQILAKQVFGSHSVGGSFAREEYLEKGPIGIWHNRL